MKRKTRKRPVRRPMPYNAPPLFAHAINKLQEEVSFLMQTTGGLWRQQDGTIMAIRQMSDNHLNNAIRMLMATSGSDNEALANMRKEVARRQMDKRWQERTDGSAYKKLHNRNVLEGAIKQLESLLDRHGNPTS